jgi:non-heme chloroperoxidase
VDIRKYKVESADGTMLSVHETGNSDGHALLLIHGFAQSQLCFRKQLKSPLAERFRIVSFDLRGHGESDQPASASAYTEGKRWADDVAAVIKAAKLDRPVLAGWSLGGRVIAQYLALFGDAALGGINFVGSRTIVDPARNTLGPGAAYLTPMQSDDLETNISATASFLRACVATPLPSEEFEYMLAYNMVSPPRVRAAVLKWPGDFAAALSRIAVPCLLSHGRRDEVVLPAAAEISAATIGRATLSWYDESGHSPFWEEPERFNAELSAFAGGL